LGDLDIGKSHGVSWCTDVIGRISGSTQLLRQCIDEQAAKDSTFMQRMVIEPEADRASHLRIAFIDTPIT
jgi:hypothetical protein